MKVQALPKIAVNPELEAIIRKKDAELKELARKNGKVFAINNQPAPKGDKLPSFVGDIITGYEHLGAQLHHEHLQTATHMPEGQIEADRAKAKCKQMEDAIFHLEEQNKHDEYELQSFDSKSVWNRIYLAIAVTLVILIGEIAFNTKAFEFAGESLLFALTISLSVSFAVYALSHVAPMLYKEIRDKIKRRLFAASVLAVTLIAFYVLGVFRSNLLAQNEASISPVFFVIINFFLFMVSVFLSYYLMPTWEEIKGSFHNRKLHRAINKRKKEIAALHDQIEVLNKYIEELARQIIRINIYTEYTDKRIEKLCYESISIFKNVNLIHRTDRKVPDCFHDELPPIYIQHLIAQPFIDNNNAQ